jgi:hypothetical protein
MVGHAAGNCDRYRPAISGFGSWKAVVFSAVSSRHAKYLEPHLPELMEKTSLFRIPRFPSVEIELAIVFCVPMFGYDPLSFSTGGLVRQDHRAVSGLQDSLTACSG